MKKKIIIAASIALIATGSFKAIGADKNAVTTQTSQTNADKTLAKQAEELIEKAQAGDAEAQYELGVWIYEGKYFESNKEKALKWWIEAAKHKYARAATAVGKCYYKGIGVEKPDSLKSISYYLTAFKLGDTEALKDIEDNSEKSAFAAVVAGDAYLNGAGVKKDLDKTIYYYHSAAKLGSQDVIYPLAQLTYQVKDYPAALKWFKKASTLKSLSEDKQLSSSYWYGKLLLDGASGKAEPEAAFPYILHAAEKGLAGAQIQTARCYWDGLGTETDAKKGYEWMMSAARQGKPEAQWEVAMAMLQKKGTDINFPLAFQWMTIAANNSSINRFKKWIAEDETLATYPDYILWLQGLKCLANNDFDGTLSVSKSLKKAKYTDLASYLEAMVLINPDYKKNNQKKGVTTLEKLASTNNYINWQLAKLVASGKITASSLDPVKMLDKCVNNGFTAAYETLGDIYFDGRGADKNINKSLINYLKAKDAGMLSAAGYKRLAAFYDNGWGVEKNSKKAEALKKASPRNLEAEMLKLVPSAK